MPSSINVAAPITLQQVFNSVEEKYNVPKNLMYSIAKVESNFKHKAFIKHDGVSKHSSYGLLQLQYRAAKDVGFKGNPIELMDPSINIEWGTKYFNWLLKRNRGDVSLALTAWNKGPYNKEVKNKIYSAYVGKVLNVWAMSI